MRGPEVLVSSSLTIRQFALWTLISPTTCLEPSQGVLGRTPSRDQTCCNSRSSTSLGAVASLRKTMEWHVFVVSPVNLGIRTGPRSNRGTKIVELCRSVH